MHDVESGECIMKAIRGIVEYDAEVGQWVAMSLEFGLAAQSDTEDDAKQKLIAQIQEYLEDAVGIHKEHQAMLLKRKAPFSIYLSYYWLLIKGMFRLNGNYQLFCKSANDFAPNH